MRHVTITITERHDEEEDDDQETTYTVSDDGGEWDDEAELSLTEAEAAVEERVDHYRKLGMLTSVEKF